MLDHMADFHLSEAEIDDHVTKLKRMAIGCISVVVPAAGLDVMALGMALGGEFLVRDCRLAFPDVEGEV